MQDGGHPKDAAEVLGIAAEAEQGGGGDLKEEPVDQPRVPLGEGVEVVGKREDDVEVRDGGAALGGGR